MSLSVKETAEIMRVDESTIFSWVVSGGIPYHKVGGELCFFPQELKDWALASGHKLNCQLLQGDELSLAGAVCTGGVFYDASGRNSFELIEWLVAHIKLPVHIERQSILDKVLAREKMTSTAVGEGIAIPHMHQSIDLISVPVVACALLLSPVEWQPGQLVNLIFLPCCPNMRIHLNFLMKIAMLGKNRAMLDRLTSRPPANQVIELLSEIDYAREVK